jgi:hypothetical protein
MEVFYSTPDIRELCTTSHFNLLPITPHKLDPSLWSTASLHHPPDTEPSTTQEWSRYTLLTYSMEQSAS